MATSASANNDRAGWTFGVGSEWMFAKQWSAKVEYLYMDYGHINDSFIDVGTFAVLGINSHVTDIVVRAGVNFHFHRTKSFLPRQRAALASGLFYMTAEKVLTPHQSSGGGAPRNTPLL